MRMLEGNWAREISLRNILEVSVAKLKMASCSRELIIAHTINGSTCQLPIINIRKYRSFASQKPPMHSVRSGLGSPANDELLWNSKTRGTPAQAGVAAKK